MRKFDTLDDQIGDVLDDLIFEEQKSTTPLQVTKKWQKMKGCFFQKEKFRLEALLGSYLTKDVPMCARV